MKHLRFYLFLPALCILFAGSCSKKGTTGPITHVDTIPVSTIKYIDTLSGNSPFVHPGGLHITEDFTRIKANVNAGTEPWISGWNKLIVNSHAQLTYLPHPTVKIVRGGNTIEEPDPDNYSYAYNDVAAAYQTAIRWKVTGNAAYADKSIQILNAWAATCVKVSGDPNVALAFGIYGYQFAVAGELMRDYSGWMPADFLAYQQWMLNVFMLQTILFWLAMRIVVLTFSGQTGIYAIWPLLWQSAFWPINAKYIMRP